MTRGSANRRRRIRPSSSQVPFPNGGAARLPSRPMRLPWPMLLCLLVLAVAAGCDSIDPTAQAFGITFRNDTGRSVNLKLCGDSRCTRFDYSDSWKAGEDAQENVSDRQILTRWLVEDDLTGRTLGCPPLEFDQKYEDVLVRVSQRTRRSSARCLLTSMPTHPGHDRRRSRRGETVVVSTASPRIAATSLRVAPWSAH